MHSVLSRRILRPATVGSRRAGRQAALTYIRHPDSLGRRAGPGPRNQGSRTPWNQGFARLGSDVTMSLTYKDGYLTGLCWMAVASLIRK